MINYYPVELHSHTNHSDGSFSPKELVESAKEFAYEAIFITDHNTNSALEGLEEVDGIKVYPGFEITSFYGHVLVLGDDNLWDFTKLRQDKLEDFIKDRSSSKNLAIGLAHPYDMGSPFCTGCHLDFGIDDFSNIDYIEIFNGPNPNESYANDLAYKKWRSLIKRGYKLAALGGRDWHGPDGDFCNFYINMVGSKKLSLDRLINSIESAKTYISMGPKIIYEIRAGRNLDFGDETHKRDIGLKISLEKTNFNKDSHIEIERILAINNDKIILDEPISYKNFVNTNLRADYGPLHFEVLGKVDHKDVRILISSPIYIRRQNEQN